MAVVEKDIPSQLVASLKNQMTASQLFPFISASAISLMEYLKEINVDVAGPGLIIYNHIDGGKVDIEACLPAASKGNDRGTIKFRELEGGKAATLLVTGKYIH
jgi:hypothetical protein